MSVVRISVPAVEYSISEFMGSNDLPNYTIVHLGSTDLPCEKYEFLDSTDLPCEQIEFLIQLPPIGKFNSRLQLTYAVKN